MQGVLEIQSMSVAEKLSAINQLWESLEKVEIPSPNWHQEVLENRQNAKKTIKRSYYIKQK